MIRPGETVIVEVARGDVVKKLRVTLATDIMTGSNGQKMRRGVFGIGATRSQLKPMPIAQVSPRQSTRPTG